MMRRIFGNCQKNMEVEMNIIKILKDEFNISDTYVKNIIQLIDDDNTIPFIARYRKELHGSLDDQILREFSDRLNYLRNLNDKKDQILNTIREQEKLTPDIEKAIELANTLTELEDIYRPFRPKRRTRATIAKEKGLEPLAKIILEQNNKTPILEIASEYINEEMEVMTADHAINYAKDIIAEIIADEPKYRSAIRKYTFDHGKIITSNKEDNPVYEMYYNFEEPIKTILGHRTLAFNRGEKEKVLSVKVEVDTTKIIETMEMDIVKNNGDTKEILVSTIEDAYKRLISPAVEREIRSELTEKAENGAIKVFKENLSQLLMAAPIKNKKVLALDPAFRTGCKFAIINEFGTVLETGVIYPTAPKNDIEGSKKILMPLIEKHGVELVAIGNGTASRETEAFAVAMIKEFNRPILYCIVNEAGASVYSASKLGAKEFPDFDVALRSAVSIGRRLQDPLAELVKIDPKSIGVGQYQHDMNQKNLTESLNGVVEDCVNKVGVDLNNASPKLLSFVSGISSTVSENIVAYKEENGSFKTRKELLKVSKLGPKAYTQCGGFLRVVESDNPLDNTGIHPESYDIAIKFLEKLELTLVDVTTGNIKGINKNRIEEIAKELDCGVPTLTDIINELEKPGRDIRDNVEAPILRSDVLEMKDLKEGMILKGTVRNVIDFGAFIDIGVHQDGLVHISQISKKFIKHPLDIINVGDIVEVKIIGIDINKKRISLSMILEK